MPLNLRYRPTALLLFRRKSYSGFLCSKKIHRPRPSLNPRTSDPVASITTTGFEQSEKDYRGKDKDVYVVFGDLEKAFDRLDWKKLMRILKKIGVDWKERKLLGNLYMKQRIKVRIGEEMSEGREIGRRYGKNVLYRL